MHKAISQYRILKLVLSGHITLIYALNNMNIAHIQGIIKCHWKQYITEKDLLASYSFTFYLKSLFK